LSNSRRLGAVLAWLVAAPSFLGAQQPATPTPLRLSFADAVRVASGQATPVELATLRTTEADARVRQARSALLPSLAISGAWVNRTFNSKSLGISFPTPPGQPGLPELIGPFDNYDGRVRATQTVFDWSSVKRVRAAGAQADGTRAERGATGESAAQTAAAAYLRAEVARGAAARQTGSAIRAERLPRLDLEADYGVNGLTMPSAISTRQVALQVTVPILDGFHREARIAEQNATVSESRVRERDLRQQIAADVDAALLDLRSAEAQQSVAAERLRLATDELAQARERFKAGVAGNIEVIDAQSNLIRARDTDIDARFAAASARVALARAVGVASTLH